MFFSNKILLLLVIPAVILSGCTYVEMGDGHSHPGMKVFEISPTHLFSIKDSSNDLKLLDVREDSEYGESHISDSLLLSVNNISQANLDAIGLEKTDEIVVYDRSGRRSETAYNILSSLGYENVKSLMGGIIHWMEEGYPVEEGLYLPPNQTQQNTSSARIEVDRKTHDFGEIPQFGGTVSANFTVRNSGSQQLIIDYISTSCGCTTAEIGKENLAPGEETILTVFFDPDFHEEPLDKFSRTVFIGSNDHESPEIEVRIFVDILEGV